MRRARLVLETIVLSFVALAVGAVSLYFLYTGLDKLLHFLAAS